MNVQTVLIIDDNQFILKLVRDILDKQGYLTFTAKTGMGGIQIARDEHPDLIILDRHLEDISGHKVLRDIKDNLETSNIPVTMLSSDNHYDQIIRSMSLGAEDYIVKPFKSGTLLKKVKRLISTSRGKAGDFFYI